MRNGIRGFIATAAILIAVPLYARGVLRGYVGQGGAAVTVSSAQSVSKFQITYPSSLVEVRISGTSTKATLYDSAGSAVSNPVRASSKAYFSTYVDDGDYDLVFSGGTITSPWTEVGWRVASGSASVAATGDAATIGTALALADASVSAKVVSLPCGVWIWSPSTSLLQGSNVVLQGSGPCSVLKHATPVAANNPILTNTNSQVEDNLPTGTGTITFTSGLATVTGSGTAFTTQFTQGTVLRAISGGIKYLAAVKTIASNTSLTLDRIWGYPTISGTAYKYAIGNYNLIVRDLAIDGSKRAGRNWTTGTNGNDDGILFSFVRDSAIERVWVYDHEVDGIILQYCRRIKVADCHTNGNLKDGLYLSGSDDSNVINHSATYNGLGGVTIASSWYNTLSNSAIRFNQLDFPGTSSDIGLGRGSGGNLVSSNVAGSILCDAVAGGGNNTLPYQHSTNMVLDNGITAYGCYGDSVVNNDLYATDGYSASGIYFKGGSHNRIINNRIHDSSNNGLVLAGEDHDLVSLNEINSSNRSLSGFYAVSCVRLSAGGPNCTDNIFDSNYITDSQLLTPTTVGGFFVGVNSARNLFRNNLGLVNSISMFSIDASVTATTMRVDNRYTPSSMWSGRATLIGGTITVGTAEVRTGDNIHLTNVSPLGTATGTITLGAIVDQTSFVINSLRSTGVLETNDTSVIYWRIDH
jgi:parallel beta-helix repeat protein